MAVALRRAASDRLDDAVQVLREWQYEGAPVQLHPGDVGWYQRFGAEATAAAIRIWSRGGRTLALGLLDGPRILRLAIAPDARQDEELAGRMFADVTQPERGVLPDGEASIEARFASPLQVRLRDAGWGAGESWTPLTRDLAEPPADGRLRIEVTGPDSAGVRAAVQRAAFDSSTFTAARWHLMAAGPAYRDARCLVGYDEGGAPVATATVWSAGPGRPGLLEPMGVDREHRGHGHGRAITVAAAVALREMGSSSAIVCTRAANSAAVATYRAAGFQRLPDVPDLRRGLSTGPPSG